MKGEMKTASPMHGRRAFGVLAVVLALAMVVCAFAVAVPENDAEAASVTPVEIGTATDITSPKEGAGWTVDGNTITLSQNVEWKLTADVSVTAQIDLNGKNLKISGAHTLTVSYSGAGVSAVIKSSIPNGSIDIDAATVKIVGNGTTSSGTWAVEADNIDTINLVNKATIDVSKSSSAADTGVVFHTDPSNEGKSKTVINLNDSTIKFSNAKSTQTGVAVVNMVAVNNSVIDASNLVGGTLSVYADLNDSKIIGKNVNLYAAKLVKSSISASESVNVLAQTAATSVYAVYTLKEVCLDGDSSITAKTIGVWNYKNNATMEVTFDGVGDTSKTFGVLNGNIDLKSGVSYVLKGVTYNGTVTNTKTSDNVTVFNSATFTNVKAGAEGVTISQGSIRVNGQVQTGSTIVVTEGEATINGTLDEGSTLIIEKGVKATLDGSLTNNGTIELYGELAVSGNTFTNDGKLVIDPSSKMSGTITGGGAIVQDPEMQQPFYIGGEIEFSQPIGNATLQSDLTIPEGITLTVNGNLFLNGNNIYVKGTLVVSNGASIYTLDPKNGIILSETGVIENNGIIGNAYAVTVSYGTQKVTMQGVSGVEFSIEKIAGVMTLIASGNVSKISAVDTNVLTVDGASIGNMTVGKKVTLTLSNDANVISGSSVVIDGTISAATKKLTLKQGASFTLNGKDTGVMISAETGKLKTTTEYDGATDSVDVTIGENVKGVVISTAKVAVPENGKTNYYVKAFINGSVDVIDKTIAVDGNEGKFTVSVTGTVYVSDDATLTITDKISYTATKTVIKGTIVFEDVARDVLGGKYDGAMYTVTVKENGVTKSETTYYKSFDAAMAEIETADDKTINAIIDKITKSYTIAAGQTVTVKDTTIASDAVITVEAEASFTGVKLIEGMLVVKENGQVGKISSTAYAVKSVSEDNTVTYAGFKVAIANAKAGDVITVSSGSTTEDLVIPEGVKVIINNELTVGGNLTVSKDAELVVKGALKMTNGKNAKVYGTMDVSGSMTGNFELYSTGTTSLASGIDMPAKTNGAYYTDVKSGKLVITSVASAAAYAASNEIESVTVVGVVSESSEVSFKDVDLIIDGTVSITKVNLDNAKVQVESGKSLTATVSGLVADGKSVGVVELSKYTNGAIDCSSTEDATGAVTYTTTINAFNNGVTIVSGTVVFKATADAVFDSSVDGTQLVINADATLKVASKLTITNGKNIKINGTLLVASEVGISNVTSTVSSTDASGAVHETVVTNTAITIDGNVLVSKGTLSINGKIVLTGTITVSEEKKKEGVMNINGSIYLGKTPETLGAAPTLVGPMTLGANAYIFAYPGASIDAAKVNVDAYGVSAMKNTAFSVNGKLYATVYALGGVKISDVKIADEIKALKDVKSGVNVEWYNGEEKVDNSTAIGKYAELKTEVEYMTVKIIVSAGPGLEIYVDNVKANGETDVSVGQHTVTVYVMSGYEGTPAVTFNGQTVSGTFTVTSDMDKVVLSATGATPSQSTVIIDSGDKGEDGMSLTDILLIVLVVLIAVMAIMVALRMMRS